MNDKKFGIPEQKKFPLFDLDHVKSAIKFFNYVDPKYEGQLAKAILRRAKEYGLDLSEMSIGDNNRFKKYLPSNKLKHYGVLGQKWDVWRAKMSEYLIHSNKGSTWKNHKYISKKTVKGKTRYLYNDVGNDEDIPNENSVWEIGKDGKYYIDGKEVSYIYWSESYESAAFNKYYDVPKELKEELNNHLKDLKDGKESKDTVETITSKWLYKEKFLNQDSNKKELNSDRKTNRSRNQYLLHRASGDELYHWGIRGMKRGVRRYQYYLTKEDYLRDQKKN